MIKPIGLVLSEVPDYKADGYCNALCMIYWKGVWLNI